MASIRDEVIAVIRQICREEKPDLSDDDKPLLAAGLDSLDFASVLMAIEDKYGLQFGEADMDRISSIRGLTAFIAERRDAGPPDA